MRILCRHPKGKKGCSECGGRGWVVESYSAGCCGRKIWCRSWLRTVYVGKKYTTFNGIEMTVVDLDPYGEVCDRCHVEKV